MSFIIFSAPQEVLLFALAGRGEVAYVDTGSPEATGDLYLVGHSLRPVAVAYDSVEQVSLQYTCHLLFPSIDTLPSRDPFGQSLDHTFFF